jgi:hypothetical protein
MMVINHCFDTNALFFLVDVKSDSTEKIKTEAKEIDNEAERLNEETKKGDEAGIEVENKREKTGRSRTGRGRSDQVCMLFYVIVLVAEPCSFCSLISINI